MSDRPPKPEARPCKWGCGRPERITWDARRYRGLSNCQPGNAAWWAHRLRCVERDAYLSFGCFIGGRLCTEIATCIDHRHAPPMHPKSFHSCPTCRVGPACERCNIDGVRETMEHFEGVEWTVHRLSMFSKRTGWTPPASDLIAQGGSLAAVHLLTTTIDLPHVA